MRKSQAEVDRTATSSSSRSMANTTQEEHSPNIPQKHYWYVRGRMLCVSLLLSLAPFRAIICDPHRLPGAASPPTYRGRGHGEHALHLGPLGKGSCHRVTSERRSISLLCLGLSGIIYNTSTSDASLAFHGRYPCCPTESRCLSYMMSDIGEIAGRCGQNPFYIDLDLFMS